MPQFNLFSSSLPSNRLHKVSLAHNHYFWGQKLNHNVSLWSPRNIAKPFSPRELISRVKAVLRRVGREDLKEPIIVGDLVFDPLGHISLLDL